MLKAESILLEEIVQRGMRRLGVDQQLQQTRVIPREDFKYSSLLGVEMKLEDSVEAEVPLYVGEQLFEDGMADPVDKALDSKALSMIAWEERHRTGQISKVPNSFYRQLVMLISSDNVAEKTKRVLEASAIEVMDARLKKILTYSLVPSLPRDVVSNLTPEESYVLELLRLVISSWRKEVLKIGRE